VLISDGEAAVFDPSHYLEEYEAIIDAHDAELVGVFDTHAHADHVSGGADLAERHDVPYFLHPTDAIAIDATPIEDGESVAIGSVDVEVIHTPGHSEGSVSFDLEGKPCSRAIRSSTRASVASNSASRPGSRIPTSKGTLRRFTRASSACWTGPTTQSSSRHTIRGRLNRR